MIKDIPCNARFSAVHFLPYPTLFLAGNGVFLLCDGKLRINIIKKEKTRPGMRK